MNTDLVEFITALALCVNAVFTAWNTWHIGKLRGAERERTKVLLARRKRSA